MIPPAKNEMIGPAPRVSAPVRVPGGISSYSTGQELPTADLSRYRKSEREDIFPEPKRGSADESALALSGQIIAKRTMTKFRLYNELRSYQRWLQDIVNLRGQDAAKALEAEIDLLQKGMKEYRDQSSYGAQLFDSAMKMAKRTVELLESLPADDSGKISAALVADGIEVADFNMTQAEINAEADLIIKEVQENEISEFELQCLIYNYQQLLIRFMPKMPDAGENTDPSCEIQVFKLVIDRLNRLIPELHKKEQEEKNKIECDPIFRHLNENGEAEIFYDIKYIVPVGVRQVQGQTRPILRQALYYHDFLMILKNIPFDISEALKSAGYAPAIYIPEEYRQAMHTYDSNDQLGIVMRELRSILPNIISGSLPDEYAEKFLSEDIEQSTGQEDDAELDWWQEPGIPEDIYEDYLSRQLEQNESEHRESGEQKGEKEKADFGSLLPDINSVEAFRQIDRDDFPGIPEVYEAPEYEAAKINNDPMHILLRAYGLDSDELGIVYKAPARIAGPDSQRTPEMRSFTNYHDYMRFRLSFSAEEIAELDSVAGRTGRPGPIMFFDKQIWKKLNDPADDLFKYREGIEMAMKVFINGQYPDNYALMALRQEAGEPEEDEGEEAEDIEDDVGQAFAGLTEDGGASAPPAEVWQQVTRPRAAVSPEALEAHLAQTRKETATPPSSEPAIPPAGPISPRHALEIRIFQDNPKFDKLLADFNISYEELGAIPEYVRLSPGQQLLILENLRQITLGRIQVEAATEYQEQTAQAGFLGRLWRKFSHNYQLAKLQRQQAEKIMGGGMEKHKDIIIQLARGMDKFGPEASIEQGKLNIGFAPEWVGISGVDKKNVYDLNLAANEMARLPYEETIASARGDIRTQYLELKKRYDKYLEDYGQALAQRAGRSEEEALLAMNKIRNSVRLNQFFNSHPQAEEQIQMMRHSAVWSSVFNNVLDEEGTRSQYGFIARSVSMTMLTFISLPLAAASFGAMKFFRNATRQMKINDLLARRGIADRSPTAKSMVPADYYSSHLEILAGQAQNAGLNEGVRGNVLRTLHSTVFEVKYKLERGEIDFGDSAEEKEGRESHDTEGPAGRDPGNDIDPKSEISNKFRFVENLSLAIAELERIKLTEKLQDQIKKDEKEQKDLLIAAEKQQKINKEFFLAKEIISGATLGMAGALAERFIKRLKFPKTKS